MAQMYVQMPVLDSVDLVKMSRYQKLMSKTVNPTTNKLYVVTLIIDHDKKRFLVIKDGVVGFIQKVKGVLRIDFKDKTHDNVDRLVRFDLLLESYNIFPEDELGNVKFNIGGIAKMLEDANTARDKG